MTTARSVLLPFLVAFVLVTCVGGLALPRTMVPAANAALGEACANDDYGAMSAIEQPDQSFSNDSRGTRGDEQIASYADCQRVVSLYVSNGRGGFEFGYFIGVNMDFAKGWNVVGTERGDVADAGNARWNNLDEYRDGNGWSPFNDITPKQNGDPDYHWDILATDSARTVHD